jgi:hypothetical protein
LQKDDLIICYRTEERWILGFTPAASSGKRNEAGEYD